MESADDRVRGEREWKEKEDITRYIRQAKEHRREEQLTAEDGAADHDRYDENRNAVEDEEGEAGEEEDEAAGQLEGAEELDGEEDEEEEDDDAAVPSSAPSSTSASPEPTPSNSPLPRPSTLPPPPPAADFHSSMNGTWTVLRNYSQDVSPILKKMGVSWMDRSMSSNQDQVTMNVGRSILVCVDRSSLGTAELRYVIDGQWHDGMSFGGKEGKVRVAIERTKPPFSISIETQWLKDKRSKFQQLVEPSGHAISYNPAAPPGRRGIPIGFVVVKLIDVRVLERRAIVKQMLHYVENEAVRLVCVRYLRKVESREERRRGEELERARVDYERLRAAYEREQSAAHGLEKKEPAAGKRKRKKRHPTAPPEQTETEAERLERLMSVEEGKPASPIRFSGGYRRMSTAMVASAQAMGQDGRVNEPNPLLMFLPIRLVLEGGRKGQAYMLLAFMVLASYCAGNRWATISLALLSAFYLHYLEVLGRAKSAKRSAHAATQQGTLPTSGTNSDGEGQHST